MKSLNVLLIGSGAREHALGEAIAQSPRFGSLAVAPGNAGTARFNIELDCSDFDAVVSYCEENSIDLVIVGPEAALVDGIADALDAADIACFGPSAAAARLEGSKSFARAFAQRHGIPGPRCASFTEVEAAQAWAHQMGAPVVVKADGLASGKGVIVPETKVETERAIFDLLAEKTLGAAGATVVLEERLFGEEISLFGIADGTDVVILGTAQDHKRVGDGNTGLNTGGMGAFAPVPGKQELEAELAERFLDPVVKGMAAEGTPFVGVIYAGIMLTESGPRLVEYNCRFGDPEAQVLLPLLETDLLSVLWAAANGELGSIEVQRKANTTAATVVVAAKGYPVSPALDVAIPEVAPGEGVTIYHASTRLDADGTARSTGGRVLAVTASGADLTAALDRVYETVDQCRNDQLFARRDIGWRYAPSYAVDGPKGDAYARAGVSFATAAAITDGISRSVRSTHDARVVAGIGSFGGVFDIGSLARLDQPLLVASTDGVGTKTLLAAEVGRWHSIGVDIVNHGVNDVLVQGAKPLFFLDTVAAATLQPEVVTEIVEGMAAACRDAECVLLGGETAEMPDVLAPGALDVSGTMVGAVDRSQLLPRATVEPGHVLVGLRSSGLHTNGYSLARQAVKGKDLGDPVPGGDGETFAEALLAPHRSYLAPLSKALGAGLVDAMAHITGGGLIDNLPRVLPAGCGAVIDTSAWEWPAIFRYLVAEGGLGPIEAHQVLNLGIGMVVVVAPGRVDELQTAIAEPTVVIGRVVAGQGVALG